MSEIAVARMKEEIARLLSKQKSALSFGRRSNRRKEGQSLEDYQTEIEKKLEEQVQKNQTANMTANEEPSLIAQAPLQPDEEKAFPSAKAPKRGRGIIGLLVAIGVVIMKTLGLIVAVLLKIKFILIALISMAASVWAYSIQSGWAFAVGIVALIFIHESGHASANKIKGLKTGPMVFIPFCGAFVTGEGGRTLEEDAYIGIMGPVFGTLASVICIALGFLFHSVFLLGLAYFGFFINLFNLLPIPPLDGAWITPLFSPKLLALGAIGAFFAGFSNPLIWLLGLASLPRIIGGWKANPETMPYYRVSTATK